MFRLAALFRNICGAACDIENFQKNSAALRAAGGGGCSLPSTGAELADVRAELEDSQRAHEVESQHALHYRAEIRQLKQEKQQHACVRLCFVFLPLGLGPIFVQLHFSVHIFLDLSG